MAEIPASLLSAHPIATLKRRGINSWKWENFVVQGEASTSYGVLCNRHSEWVLHSTRLYLQTPSSARLS